MKRCSTSYVFGEIQLKQQWGNTTDLIKCPNFGTLITPNAVEAKKQEETLRVEMQNGTATLKDSLEISYQTKDTCTTWSSNSAP